jgi:DNA-binding transcriptional regulator YbjK
MAGHGNQPAAAHPDQPTTPHADPPTAPHSDQPTTPHSDQPTTPHSDQPTTPHADPPTTPHSDRPMPQHSDPPPAQHRAPLAAGNGGRKVQRTRDPEARKRALAAAALEIVAEVGIGRTTHRAVAARAGLPLGATTYYFPTLDDLIAAGLAQATNALRADLLEWEKRLRAAPSLAEALVDLTEECLNDRPRTQIEYELYVAAARDAALRPLALAWLDGLNDILVPRVGATAARNISALLDGAMIQCLVTEEPLDRTALTDAISRLSA